jgi:hypothetical protein
MLPVLLKIEKHRQKGQIKKPFSSKRIKILLLHFALPAGYPIRKIHAV